MTMPGLAKRNEQLGNANGFWAKHRYGISLNQLQKFWSELPLHPRHMLLRVDKQSLFGQARKNMYCSRCNGLLLEGFLQIVMHGKCLQDGEGGLPLCKRAGSTYYYSGSNVTNDCSDDIQDPSVHPWGGLTITCDGSLTLLNCYLYSKSLGGIQKVFDSARARERERELLYPDACGGGGRGWISQGMASYGRGHGTREACALHTASLSCDTLVDFWSALGEDTRHSLLRMKEEDFIERLMYRFDSKRFCRDCRRNVIREFKDLKDLKRMRREPQCTSWFCVPDTAFHYEIFKDRVQADWKETFDDTLGIYHHFEWAIGSAEGKCDILEFENVGLNRSAQTSGLDLSGLSTCFITLRAWKVDGRWFEHSVKAHALKGHQCLHYRLLVSDGFVTITPGESIRSFFEHAEEVDEDEDDDSMDRDVSELDVECSRPQKHAKSPELAREFLLDAATIIFKEQVEKAFREGTARQNAHSIFVYLALQLLEERLHVACKEVITLEKQKMLIEEEEKEKQEEEERRERRRIREREKKLRRKERLLKGKDRDKEKLAESDESLTASEVVMDEISLIREKDDDDDDDDDIRDRDLVGETCEPCSSSSNPDGGEILYVAVETDSAMVEQSKPSCWRRKSAEEAPADLSRSRPTGDAVRSKMRPAGDSSVDALRGGTNGSNRHFARAIGSKPIGRNSSARIMEKLRSPGNRQSERYLRSCSCSQQSEYRPRATPHVSSTRIGREGKSAGRAESCHGEKAKSVAASSLCRRGVMLHLKKVWEPMDSQTKCHLTSSSSRSGKANLDEGGRDASELERRKPIFSTQIISDSSAVGNSSSDNCSSCISEADCNTGSSSAHRNHGSSSVSDSEDANPLLPRCARGSLLFPNKEPTAGKSLAFPPSLDASGNLPSKIAQNATLGMPALSSASFHRDGVFTSAAIMPNQNFQLPPSTFHASPSMSYYCHQNSLPWRPAPPPPPANCSPLFPQLNQHLYPAPVGYCLNGGGSHLFMHYDSMPRLPAAPVLGPSLVPFYHQPLISPPVPLNPAIAKQPSSMLNQELQLQLQLQLPPIVVRHPESVPSAQTGHAADKSSCRFQIESPNFSLFHFAGPVAFSTGSKQSSGTDEEFCSKTSWDKSMCDSACGKESIAAEYNLFAASSINFSLF